jgi:hypothetical protein
MGATTPTTRSGRTSRLLACLLLPELPIAAHRPVEEDGGGEAELHAVHRGEGPAARLLHVGQEALGRGLRPGQSLAAARARWADVESAPLDPARLRRAEREALAALLPWTPRLTVDRRADAFRLWAEAAPFGDVDGWKAAVRDALAPWGPVAIGIGPWAAVAQAAAWEGMDRVIPDPARARAFLDPLPLAVLEVDAASLETLAALGVRTVGALRAFDPRSLGPRFEGSVLAAWRRARGEDARGPRTPRPDRGPRRVLELDAPLHRLEALRFLLRPALEGLLAPLRAEGRGAVALRLVLRTASGVARRCEARASRPVTAPATAMALLEAHLERWSPGPGEEGAIRVELEVPETAPTEEDEGMSLFPSAHRRDPARAEATLLRLRERFEVPVERASAVEVSFPLERAVWTTEPGGAGRRGAEARPWRVLDPPAPVRAGAVTLMGRVRRIHRWSRPVLAGPRWWRAASTRTRRMALVEVEGPVVLLLTAEGEGDWAAVAWVD